MNNNLLSFSAVRRMALVSLLTLVGCVALHAQNYRNSRYYDARTDRLNYHRSTASYWGRGGAYYGLRIGPSFTSVSSDDPFLDGSSTKTGLNVGIAAGYSLGYVNPLYLETGLYYTEKGGKGNAAGSRFTYDLDYLEVPFVLKLGINAGSGFSVQPFLGGYLACGVGGKIKDFQRREAYSSFSSSDYTFQRFDGGLRMGCGVQYEMLYADLTYDLGLANISHNYFDESRNSALMLTFGVQF